MTRSMTHGLRTLALTCAAALISVAQAAPVGLVTDIDGAALQAGEPLRLLADLASGTELDIAQGGRVVVFYFSDGNEWTLAGPGRYRLAARAPEAQAAALAPQKRAAPAAYRQFKLRADRIAQGGMVMRGGERPILATPVDEVVLDRDVRFAWEPFGTGAKYQFELVDTAGSKLLATDTPDIELRLPSAVQLQSGRTYFWSLRGRDASGSQTFYRATEFRMADAATKQKLATAAPKAGAPFSERALYVAMLEDLGAKSAARSARRELAQERSAAWVPAR